MHWSIDQLRGVMSPPLDGGDQVDWREIEEVSGVIFPEDYRDFVGIYGGGSIDDYLSIITPPSLQGSPYGNLTPTMGRPPNVRSWPHPYPPFPHAGGILLWGSDDDADDVFWLCRDPSDPSSWATVVKSRQRRTWIEFGEGFGEFLLGLILGRIENPFAQDSFPSAPIFTSWREEV